MGLTCGQKSIIMAVSAMLALGMAVPAGAGGYRGGAGEALGPRYDTPRHDTPVAREARARHRSPAANGPASWVKHWNEIAIDASGLDHTSVASGQSRIFGEQLGPGRSSRAMAIVHVAISGAVNAVVGDDQSYTRVQSPHGEASMEAAIAQAAHDTLVALFPSQTASFDEQLTKDLGRIHDGRAKAKGIETGQRAAAAILARRIDDGVQAVEPQLGIDFITSDEPGMWRQDPISLVPIALGAYWGAVKPFVLPSTAEFRVPPPPALHSQEYAAAFLEVKLLGGDGVITPTERTEDQTTAGIYWAYDGTPSLCAPPRLYNQIAVQIAEQMGSNVVELARLLALVNVAMADAGIAIWESKYHYNVWRPVTGIREADEGSGPTGAGDGNPATVGDPTFSPLGAPASNLTGPNFTPPFPAYPSGHAGLGGALFQTLRRFYGTDQIAFTFVSDEFNGVTLDNSGAVRPLVRRHFATLSEAEEENGQSRIYLGIHWAFDKTEGIAQGRRVADYVFDNLFAR
jgi:VCPO second helical-bundle domain